MTANGSTVFAFSPRGREDRPNTWVSITLLFRQFTPENSDLLLLHAGSEFMGMLNLEAGGFLQIRLP